MMDDRILTQLRETAQLAALRAGQVIRERYAKPRTVRQKYGPRDLVTDTDHAAQAAALSVIRERHPEHTILSEEDTAHHATQDGRWNIPDGTVWLVDPLDGTTNYASGLPIFCASVGVAIDGEPVAGAIHDPLRKELFLAARGLGATLNERPLSPLDPVRLEEAVISLDWAREPAMRDLALKSVTALAPRCRTVRALGSAALAQAYVACGRVQIYFNFGLYPWDVGASAVIIREVGGELCSLDRDIWQLGDSALIAGHPALVGHIRQLIPVRRIGGVFS